MRRCRRSTQGHRASCGGGASRGGGIGCASLDAAGAGGLYNGMVHAPASWRAASSEAPASWRKSGSRAAPKLSSQDTYRGDEQDAKDRREVQRAGHRDVEGGCVAEKERKFRFGSVTRRRGRMASSCYFFDEARRDSPLGTRDGRHSHRSKLLPRRQSEEANEGVEAVLRPSWRSSGALRSPKQLLRPRSTTSVYRAKQRPQSLLQVSGHGRRAHLCRRSA